MTPIPHLGLYLVLFTNHISTDCTLVVLILPSVSFPRPLGLISRHPRTSPSKRRPGSIPSNLGVMNRAKVPHRLQSTSISWHEGLPNGRELPPHNSVVAYALMPKTDRYSIAYGKIKPIRILLLKILALFIPCICPSPRKEMEYGEQYVETPNVDRSLELVQSLFQMQSLRLLNCELTNQIQETKFRSH